MVGPPPTVPQVVKAFSEAEAHRGPSLIIAYAPCAMHGIAEGMGESAKDAKVGGWDGLACAVCGVGWPFNSLRACERPR